MSSGLPWTASNCTLPRIPKGSDKILRLKLQETILTSGKTKNKKKKRKDKRERKSSFVTKCESIWGQTTRMMFSIFLKKTKQQQQRVLKDSFRHNAFLNLICASST